MREQKLSIVGIKQRLSTSSLAMRGQQRVNDSGWKLVVEVKSENPRSVLKSPNYNEQYSKLTYF